MLRKPHAGLNGITELVLFPHGVCIARMKGKMLMTPPFTTVVQEAISVVCRDWIEGTIARIESLTLEVKRDTIAKTDT